MANKFNNSAHRCTAQPGLGGLLLFIGITNFMLGIVQVLVTPRALTIVSPEKAGLILGIGGSGMVVGSIMMSVWGGPKRRVLSVLGFTLARPVAVAGWPAADYDAAHRDHLRIPVLLSDHQWVQPGHLAEQGSA